MFAGCGSWWSGERKKGESARERAGDGRGTSRGELKDACRFEWDERCGEDIFEGLSLIVVRNRKGPATKLPRAESVYDVNLFDRPSPTSFPFSGSRLRRWQPDPLILIHICSELPSTMLRQAWHICLTEPFGAWIAARSSSLHRPPRYHYTRIILSESFPPISATCTCPPYFRRPHDAFETYCTLPGFLFQVS